MVAWGNTATPWGKLVNRKKRLGHELSLSRNAWIHSLNPYLG